MSATMIVLIVLGVLAVFLIAIYNRLVSLKVRSEEAWSGIDVQLKKRSDMLPNLVETVKGYASHEKSVLENVTKARSMMNDAGGDVQKTAEADNFLKSTLKSLFAVVENYPNLKADENFKMLQVEISGIEDKISYARQFYNETVKMYNEYQMLFPAVLFAGILGHSKKQFFEAEEADKKNVQVKF